MPLLMNEHWLGSGDVIAELSWSLNLVATPRLTFHRRIKGQESAVCSCTERSSCIWPPPKMWYAKQMNIYWPYRPPSGRRCRCGTAVPKAAESYWWWRPTRYCWRWCGCTIHDTEEKQRKRLAVVKPRHRQQVLPKGQIGVIGIQGP